MFSHDGLTLPDEVEELLNDCRAFSKRLVFSPAEGDGCNNCGGIGQLNFGVVDSPPMDTAPHVTSDQKPWRAAWLINQKWYIVRRHQYPCPVCNSMTDIERSSLVTTLFENSGLEPEEKTWRLEYYAGKPGKDIAVKAARLMLGQNYRPNGWICLFGEYGRGKSGILKSLVAGFIRLGVPARYVRAEDLLSEIRSTFNNEVKTDKTNEDERSLIQKYIGFKFLAIDEIDRVSTTDWARAKLFAVLDARYNGRHRTATGIATNLDPAKLTGEWAYLAASRLKDSQRIPMAGDDLRGKRN